MKNIMVRYVFSILFFAAFMRETSSIASDVQIACEAYEVHNEFLDWSKVHSQKEAEACLLTIASRFSDPADTVAWFRQQGFTARVYDIFGKWPSDRTGTIHAAYDLSKGGEPFSRGFVFHIARMMKSGVAVAVHLDEKNQPKSVNVTFILE